MKNKPNANGGQSLRETIDESASYGAACCASSFLLQEFVGRYANLVDVNALALKLLNNVQQRIREIVEHHVINVRLSINARVKQSGILL
jgi:hypothetical protein